MDLRPLLRPRHLLLTLLVGLLAGGTIAAAGAAPDPDVPAALSAPVTFPGRAEGDRGAYSLWRQPVDAGADPSTWGEPSRTFAFEWGADERHLDHLGRMVTVNVLRTQETSTAGGELVTRNETLWLHPGTNHVLATVYPNGAAIVQEGGGFLPTSTVATTQDGLGILYRDDAPATRTSPQEALLGDALSGQPCLFLPTQGRVIPLDGAAIPGFDACWLLTAGFRQAQVSLQAVAGEPGTRQVLLSARVPSLLGDETLGRMWLQEGMPYPLRIEQVDGGDNDGMVLMTHFTRGVRPLATSADAVPFAAAVELAPRQPWGPDETGVVHPFPLSTALREAQAQDPAVADLFASAPDSYVAWATFAAFDTANNDDLRWTFGLTDGSTVLGREVLLRTPKPMSEAGVLASVGADQGVTITVGPSDWRPYGGELRPRAPADAPALLPTVASMQRAWADYHADVGSGGALTANAWGFVLAQDDGPGGYPGRETWAGHIAYTQATQLPTGLGALGPRTQEWRMSDARWRDDAEGVAVFTASRSSSQYAEATLPVAGATDAEAPAFTGGTDADAIAPKDTRFEWTPRQRAAIGLGALGAALLWWLSPLAKGGLSGLFSRIRDDELLENPTRRLARDLVEANPGIHHQDLVRRLGKGKGGAEHHLRKLVEGGILLRRAAHGYTCYFLPAQASRAAVAAAPLLKSEVAQRIVEMRRAEPLVTNAELARRLSVKPATIHYHVTRLTQAGLLVDLSGRQDAAQPA